ncbi:MAG: hypothetical protein O3A10_13665 [Chloroflexi bacterium]|nr:hypothetical protein [Chloroflexota bacterium]MDA1147511.1 hypothetical protein [Chloroflexota bacterium]
MARYEQVKDEGVRALLEQATNEMRGGAPAVAVHACCDAFLLLIEQYPDLFEENLPADEKIHHQQFPRFGARLVSVADQPGFEFDRERFSMGEAITYLDFTTDTALKRQG